MAHSWSALSKQKRLKPQVQRANREASINLKQLQYFVKVVETGNMTRAADALHVAQPSLGVQIKLLEDEVGVALLERHSRGVLPTNAGKLVYQRGIRILAEVDSLRRDVSAVAATKKRSVALGFPPSVLRLLGPDILSEAETCAPDMAIELIEERSASLEDALERNKLDAALCYNPREDPAFIRTPILEEELLFVASPARIPSDPRVSTTQVLSMPLVLSGERGVIYGLVHAEADRLKQPLQPAFSIQSVSMLKSLVKQGKAATVIPLGPVTEEITAGTMACRRISGRPLFRTLYFVRRRGNQNAEGPSIERLLDHMAQRLRKRLGDLARSPG